MLRLGQFAVVPVAVATVVTLAVVGEARQSSSPDTRERDFDTYTPGPCSATGALHGGCDRGQLVRIRVVPIVTGLVRPWHIAFMPDGNMLVTELPGRLRIVRGGTLDPRPIEGWPVASLQPRTLHSAIHHPRFSQNRYIYLSYSKGADASKTTIALARGRLDETTIADVR